jgi:NADH-quinone oxidoreductase subunit N
VNFQQLIEAFQRNTLDVSLPNFRPELALCATIVAMLLARLPRWGWKVNSFWIALPGSLVALYFAAPWQNLEAGRQEIFTGMLVYDGLTVYFRSVLMLFAVLFLVLTRLSGIPDREDSPDFYTLILGSTLGMCIMASANHLLMVFLGVEMASVPSYALAGMLKGRRTASEAALKYSVYGAGTAGVMLYGISLLAGALGSAHLPTMVQQMASLSAAGWADRQAVLMLGGLMMLVGLAFKLSAVPFHFWCPDVFEGASAEVNAFLSVASKAAALALLVRVSLGFAYLPPAVHEVVAQQTGALITADDGSSPVVAAGSSAASATAASSATASSATKFIPTSAVPRGTHELPTVDSAAGALVDRMAAARKYIVGLIALLAAVTCTFGNLAAYAQTNVKRLLAYSTIAHAGYMMMPVAAAVALVGKDNKAAESAVAAVAFYVGAYLFMNLGAFAIVAFLRNAMRSEEIADYAGLIRSCPGLAICFSLILVSLIGIPPMSGFAAKLVAFYSLVPANLYWLLAVGGINTVISLFYYLRVIKVMTIDPEPAGRVPHSFSAISAEGVYVVLITAPVVILGVWWDPLNRWAQMAASNLLS